MSPIDAMTAGSMHEDNLPELNASVEAQDNLHNGKAISQLERRPKRMRRKRQKNHSQDIIREISPAPNDGNDLSSEFNIMKSVSVQDNTTMDELDISDSIRLSADGTESQSEVNKRLVQCNICKRRMTESRLANHIRLMHMQIMPQRNDENSSSIKTKDFRCDNCGRCYSNKYTYDQHVKTHTEGRPKCTDCGSTFASAFSLYRHRAKAHNAEHNYTTHTCDLCDKIFFSSSELALHQQRHTDERIHECPECKKKFSAKGNLRIHMRTHAKEKLYKCDLCDQMFSHPYSLVTHRRIHTKELPFKCEECGKSYRSKHQLVSHTNVHKEDNPYKCDKCTKTFRSRTAFKMHQDLHEGIKRFGCRHCDRKFQCQANKSKHERRHLGIKRFKCDKCDKAFIEKQELKNHLKVHDRFAPVARAVDAKVG